MLCGSGSGNALLCASCRRELPRPHAPTCPVCAGPGDFLRDGQICGSCLKQPPAYDRCIAALRYAFPASDLGLRLAAKQLGLPTHERTLVERSAALEKGIMLEGRPPLAALGEELAAIARAARRRR